MALAAPSCSDDIDELDFDHSEVEGTNTTSSTKRNFANRHRVISVGLEILFVEESHNRHQGDKKNFSYPIRFHAAMEVEDPFHSSSWNNVSDGVVLSILCSTDLRTTPGFRNL